MCKLGVRITPGHDGQLSIAIRIPDKTDFENVCRELFTQYDMDEQEYRLRTIDALMERTGDGEIVLCLERMRSACLAMDAAINDLDTAIDDLEGWLDDIKIRPRYSRPFRKRHDPDADLPEFLGGPEK